MYYIHFKNKTSIEVSNEVAETLSKALEKGIKEEFYILESINEKRLLIVQLKQIVYIR